MAKVQMGDGLKQYMSAADETTKELLLSEHKLVTTILRFDAYFRQELLPHFSPPTILSSILFFNAYQMFLAGARMGLSGHAVAVFPLLRVALESAAYGFLIELKPELASIWTNRQKSEDDKRACRNVFTFDKAVADLQAKSPDIYALAKGIYEAAIDYGAHPNVMGVFGHVSIDENRQDGMAAVSLTSLYDASHIETIRSLCACLDFGLVIIGMTVASGADVSKKQIEDLQALSDLKNAATAEYEPPHMAA
jgi:hypothetical protein